MLLAGYETVIGDARTSVYVFCSGVISLGLGFKVDDVVNKVVSRDKDDA